MKDLLLGQESAFPIFLQEGLSHNSHVDTGISKLFYTACMSMQGLCCAQSVYKEGIDAEWTAKTAFSIAKWMLELEKQQTK